MIEIWFDFRSVTVPSLVRVDGMFFLLLFFISLVKRELQWTFKSHASYISWLLVNFVSNALCFYRYANYSQSAKHKNLCDISAQRTWRNVLFYLTVTNFYMKYLAVLVKSQWLQFLEPGVFQSSHNCFHKKSKIWVMFPSHQLSFILIILYFSPSKSKWHEWCSRHTASCSVKCVWSGHF